MNNAETANFFIECRTVESNQSSTITFVSIAIEDSDVQGRRRNSGANEAAAGAGRARSRPGNAAGLGEPRYRMTMVEADSLMNFGDLMVRTVTSC